VQGRTADPYRRSLREIYDAVAGRTVFTVSIPTWSYVPAAADFGGAQQVDRLTGIFNQVAREESEARGYRWVDIGPASISGIGTRGWVASDQLHPGDAQYAVWAEAIWPVVSDLSRVFSFRSPSARRSRLARRYSR
jgi:lysophospholipase L1-like esterase